MPAYDYKCPACNDVFEVTRAFGDRSVVYCPSCAVEAKRIFSPVGIHFKGTGFHNTDYRKKSAIPAPQDTNGGATTEGTTKSEGSEKAEKPAACSGDSSPACASCPAASE